MGEETRKRVGRLYREGKWNKEDEVAAKWAEEYPEEEEKEEEKPEPKPKSKGKK